MYPLCTRPLVCMLLGFELMHLPPNVALFALEDNQSSAKALEPTFLLHVQPASREVFVMCRGRVDFCGACVVCQPA